MKSVSFVLAVALGCHEAEAPAPAVYGMYKVISCKSGAPPCYIGGSSISQDYLDSGKVELFAVDSVRWTMHCRIVGTNAQSTADIRVGTFAPNVQGSGTLLLTLPPPASYCVTSTLYWDLKDHLRWGDNVWMERQ